MLACEASEIRNGHASNSIVNGIVNGKTLLLGLSIEDLSRYIVRAPDRHVLLMSFGNDPVRLVHIQETQQRVHNIGIKLAAAAPTNIRQHLR